MGTDLTDRNYIGLPGLLLTFILFLSVDLALTEVENSDPRLNCTLGPGSLAGCHCSESQAHTNRHVVCDGQNLRSIPSNITALVDLKITNDDIEVMREVIPYNDLEKLHLEKNQIRYVPDSTFRNLTKLKTLSLADNEISNLSPKTFYGLVALELLVLTGNKIYEVHAGVFTGSVLPALQFLKVDHCAMRHIDPNSFSGLSELQLLSIAFNRLERLPIFGDKSGLNKLIHINASDNHLDLVEGSSFVNLHSLTDLVLDRNSLTELTSETFLSVNDSLVSLSLRGNRISSVGVDSIYPLRKLQVLDLSYNLLTVINSSEPPWDSLKKLLIHDNPWDCSGCDNSWLVDEVVVMTWNTESNVICATPSNVRGESVYQNGSEGFIFSQCRQEYPQQIAPASNVTVVVLVVLVASILLLTVSFLIVVKCRQRHVVKLNGKASGEKTSLAYSKMATSSPFAIGDEDDELEEL